MGPFDTLASLRGDSGPEPRGSTSDGRTTLPGGGASRTSPLQRPKRSTRHQDANFFQFTHSSPNTTRSPYIKKPPSSGGPLSTLLMPSLAEEGDSGYKLHAETGYESNDYSKLRDDNIKSRNNVFRNDDSRPATSLLSTDMTSSQLIRRKLRRFADRRGKLPQRLAMSAEGLKLREENKTSFEDQQMQLLTVADDGKGDGDGRLWSDKEEKRVERSTRLRRYQQPESAPLLVLGPQQRTVSPGASVSMQCSARGQPRPAITWTRDGSTLGHTHRISVGSHVSLDGLVVSFVNISSADTLDGGVVTCTASNVHGTVSHSARLNVYGSPFMRQLESNVSAVEGGDAQLWCPAGGYPHPTITWTRAGLPLPPGVRHGSLPNNTLVVRRVKHEDTGRYTCTATVQHGGTAQADIVLFVLRSPKIGHFSFLNDQEENMRNQLNCMVISGDLPMTVTWLKDGQHLQHDPDRTVKQISEFSSVLVFQTLSEHHSGSYTCVVTNAAGSVNQTANLRVKVSPRWVVEPRGASGLVGDGVALHCQTRGVPQPTIIWMKSAGDEPKNFQPLPLRGSSNGGRYHIQQASNGSLMLGAVQKEDSGWYLCQASNGVGQVLSKYARLEVNAGAKMVTPGGRVTGPVGQQVQLTCEAAGDPPLSLSWTRLGTPVVSSERVSIQESPSSGSGTSRQGSLSSALVIAAVAPSDGGEYRCSATNPHATDAAAYTLVVLEPPRAPHSVTVNPTGSRSARVTWTLHQPAPLTLQYRVVQDSSTSSASGASHDSNNDAVSGSWHNVSVSSWGSEHTLSGLLPHSQYHVRLIAHNELGTSPPSDTAHLTTFEEAPTGAPSEVRVVAVDATSLAVSWRAPSHAHTHGALRGYSLSLRQQHLQGGAVRITRPVTTEWGGTEQYRVRDLLPGTLYEVAVSAFNKAGEGPLSSPRIVRATLPAEPRCPPSGVSCRGSGPSSVRVSWDPPHPHCSPTPAMGYTLTLTPTTRIGGEPTDVTLQAFTSNLEKSVSGLPAARNLSVRVAATSERGSSMPSQPAYCATHDAVPSAPGRLRAVSTGAASAVVAWASPIRPHGALLHYTLYRQPRGQSRQRDLVAAEGADSTWRELTGLQPGLPLQVWVTATTSAGEGPSTTPLTLTPQHSDLHPPLILSGGREWEVTPGSGVTLGCRVVGLPAPTVEWLKTAEGVRESSGVGGQVGVGVGSGRGKEQVLPGGDLHVSGIQFSSNYSCHARNSAGVDQVTHVIRVISQPPAPSVSLTQATHNSLNLSLRAHHDGGAPILGYTVYYRLPSGSWEEVPVAPTVEDHRSSVLLSTLPCGTTLHIYATAWNRYGTSSASSVLQASTAGKPPLRPNVNKLIEVNETCTTLRLYTWPEEGCPITGWKVEQQLEEGESRNWQVVGSPITRDTQDVGLCDIRLGSRYLYRVTALSDAGPLATLYRVTLAPSDGAEGIMVRSFVHEVSLAGGVGPSGAPSIDAPVIAGAISAVLLTTALIICLCVCVARRKLLLRHTNTTSAISSNLDSKDDQSSSKLYASLRGVSSSGHSRKDSSSTPIKRSKSQSAASLASQPSMGESYEICPYATFGMDDQETLQYGLSLHSQMSSGRDCLEGAHSRRPPSRHHHSSAAWKETDVSYGATGAVTAAAYSKCSLPRGGRGPDGELWVEIGGTQPSYREGGRPKTPGVTGSELKDDTSSESYGAQSPLSHLRAQQQQQQQLQQQQQQQAPPPKQQRYVHQQQMQHQHQQQQLLQHHHQRPPLSIPTTVSLPTKTHAKH